MLTRKEKTLLVNEFVDAFKNSSIVVFTDFTGMPVSHTDDMRMQLFKEYESEAVYKVMRNSLLKTAIKEAGLNLEDYEEFLEGSTGVFYVKSGDPIVGLKVLTEFAKKHDGKPSIKGGVLEGQIFDANKAEELSKLPSKQELIGMFVRGLNAPINGVVNVLAGTIRNLSNVLNAIKDQKSE
ncbi:50S ribosomal protein L10 [Oceanotoga sp. DSM 15011]|uniref:Large ribosomal subunit protein uL10 n=1 Tax=Oceanotoga teriensis TaxID=515440 RepID=A0AA45HI70_9BACT|nr:MULTISPECIES: 50S ribosomal protein L10 [Oceanotoga]MDO7975683.1 50S ribosomal protein L10 [Oceanotoga teriensis]PWJ90568.1 LSU ribosomal protein L10P [Oceanotoga teriensis]UYO99813.1 50S ribosomal protein L10 [Oceanotoga sp. DSM 15011]